MTRSYFASIGSSASTSLIVFLLSTSFLLLVVLDMTKFFYLKKLIISVDNTTATKTLKNII